MIRKIVAVVLVLAATVLTPFAVIGLWAERTLTDTSMFVETVAPLADNEEVRQTVSTEVSSALIDAVDAQNRLKQALSNFSGPVATFADNDLVLGSIASGINGAIESGVQSYTQSDKFGDVWLAVSTKLQEQLVAMINRDTSNAAVTLTEGKIVLDTGTAADKVSAALVEKGVPFADQLTKVPGRDVVLADTPRLQTAADVLHLVLPVAAWLWAAVLAMFALAALLWRPRARGFMWAGLGLGLAGVVTYFAIGFGQGYLQNSAPSQYQSLVAALLTVLLRFLANALLVTATLGLAILLAGWLAGGANSGRRVRAMITGPIHRWSAPLGDGWLGRVCAEHHVVVPALRTLVIAVGVVSLVAANRLSPTQVMATALGVALALLVVEVAQGAALAFADAGTPALDDPAAAGTGAPA